MAQNTPPFTKAASRLLGYDQRLKLTENSLLGGLHFRSVGPTIMSGRVTAVDVCPNDPSYFLVAYASGGLWLTRNNGASFEPIFDQQAAMTIGNIAAVWTDTLPTLIWVGTGESNSSRSSYAGTGMYKTTDVGKTWQEMGLPESHHIGKVVIHPQNTNIVWVAVVGHLYSDNAERGVFKTTDGGNTWVQTLFVNDNTGAIDIVVDPANSDILFASMWQRERRAWNFEGAGEGSGIYKSTDGGENWVLCSGKESGFPSGKNTGRIGLAIHKSGKIYAVIDNQNLRPETPDKSSKKNEDEYSKNDLRNLNKTEFLALDEKKLGRFLKNNGFPEKYDAKTVLNMVRTDKILPSAVVEYLENANDNLFETKIIGAELYASNDGGRTWAKTHEDFLDDLFFTYGYYFGKVRVAEQNPDKVYLLGVPVLKSNDGGKTFKSINGDNVHADHHALWINPNRPGHLINGNDGGINISYDDGENWFKCNAPAVGQFYTVNVDDEKPYNIYGGLQDNGAWFGPSTYKASKNWHSDGQYPFKELFGGDGMQVQIDSRDNKTVYAGFQFGNYYRMNTATSEATKLIPPHELGERPPRYNWQTPILLSKHNQDIFYMGGHKLYRSMDKGETFTPISDDLTQGGKKGNVPYGTLTTISESPLKFGLIYTGSDDGLIYGTRDGGVTWKKLSAKLPQNLWVSRVQASAHNEATVYASLNGYRWDDFTAYIYASKDFGKTWERLGTDLPNEPVNVIKEDPFNPKILYVGTDHGLYVSLNEGKNFMRFDANLPHVAVHDLVVQAREKDLVIATHGRSIFIAPIAHLQQLTPEITAQTLHVFEPEAIKYSSRWGNSWSMWLEAYTPEMEFPVYIEKADEITITVETIVPTPDETQTNKQDSMQTVIIEKPIEIKKFNAKLLKGLNYVPYDLTIDEPALPQYKEFLNRKLKPDEEPVIIEAATGNGLYYLKPGKYLLRINGNTTEKTTEFEVKVK